MRCQAIITRKGWIWKLLWWWRVKECGEALHEGSVFCYQHYVMARDTLYERLRERIDADPNATMSFHSTDNQARRKRWDSAGVPNLKADIDKFKACCIDLGGPTKRHIYGIDLAKRKGK